MGVLQAIIGLLLIFIIPGYLISWLFLKKLDFIDRIGVTVGLSICINIIVGLILGFLGIFTTFMAYSTLILIVLIALLVIRKELIHYLKIDYDSLKDKKNLVIFLILVVLLIFNFILIFQVHSNYSGLIQNPHNDAQYYEVKNFRYDFPIHADEWTHLAKAVYFIENEKIEFVNPYVNGYPYYPNYEVGFDVFTSGFFLLTGLNPVLGFKYLAAIFIVINSLLLFIFIRKLTNGYIGLLSILFFGSLKSNINILGNWFFVPLTMSLFLMFLSFYLLVSYLEDKNKNYLFILLFVYFLSILVYPLLLILIASITFVFLIIKFYNKRITWYFVFLFLILCLLFLLSFGLEKIFFLKFSNWTITTVGNINFNVFKLYGSVFSFLALIGLFIFFIKKYNLLLLIGLILSLLFILMDNIFNQTYLIPYTRAVYYSLVFLVPFSVIGLYHIFEFIDQRVGKKIGILIIVLIILGLTLYNLENYYNINNQKNIANVDSKNLVLLYILENKDYEAINFIKEKFGSEKIILADPLVSVGIYPVSQNQVISMVDSNLGAWRPCPLSEPDCDYEPLLFFHFLLNDCLWKNKLIDFWKVDFVISWIQINCPGFVEVYNKNNYVYDTRGI